MMEIGKKKVARHGYSQQVQFDYGSAQEMPYADASFDAVTCAYGVRNFSETDKGLQEMYRVLRPGGGLMVLEFSYPTRPLIRLGYDLYFTHILPFVGNLFSRDKGAYSYLNRSVKHFPYGEAFCEHLRQAGFADVRCKALTFGITTVYLVPNAEHAGQTDGCPPLTLPVQLSPVRGRNAGIYACRRRGR